MLIRADSSDSLMIVIFLCLLTGESTTKVEDSEELRRAGFVDSLLNAENSGSTTFMDTMKISLDERPVKPDAGENMDSAAAAAASTKSESMMLDYACACLYAQTATFLLLLNHVIHFLHWSQPV